MGAAGTGGAGADGEASGEFGLTSGGERRPFLVADADPIDAAASYRVGERD